uniref:Uncharacterized protein n=1 Tax=Anopheles stephensi TaxID=30069 RepID=A0A182XZI9_ANOST
MTWNWNLLLKTIIYLFRMLFWLIPDTNVIPANHQIVLIRRFMHITAKTLFNAGSHEPVILKETRTCNEDALLNMNSYRCTAVKIKKQVLAMEVDLRNAIFPVPECIILNVARVIIVIMDLFPSYPRLKVMLHMLPSKKPS